MLVLASCATTPTPESRLRDVEKLMRAGDVDQGLAMLEKAVEAAPEHVPSRLRLGGIYLSKAQGALQAGKEDLYVELLGKSQDQFLRAVELDPDEPSAHNSLGIVAAYRGDMKGARRSFLIARQLDPVQPQFHLNLAEVAVYLNRLSEAERHIDLAQKFRARPADVEMLLVLMAWKRGDYVEARDVFGNVALLNPEVSSTWNGANSIQSFEDMVDYCCKLEFCGPYMKAACEDMDRVAAERKRAVETLRREIELQTEERERISEVYRNRREIDISVEPGPEDAEPGAPSKGR